MTESAAVKTVKAETTRFGRIEVPEDKVISLPQGMVGFPMRRRFALLEHRPGSPLNWLQSLEEPGLAFVVAPPMLFDPKYQIKLKKADLILMQIDDPSQVQVWAVVTIPHQQPNAITANLKAPLVINTEKRLAAQVILDDPSYKVRQPLKLADNQNGK